MLQRRFDINKNQKWVSEVKALARNYNRRPHSTTKAAPDDVLKNPLIFAFPKHCGDEESTKPASVPIAKALERRLPRIGQLVVLSRLRSIVQKEAVGTFMREPLRVIRVDRSHPIPLIHLEDLRGERIKGFIFLSNYRNCNISTCLGGAYLEEIFPIAGKVPPKVVEKVIKQRRKEGRTEYYVSYIDHPRKFNEWIRRLPNGMKIDK